MQKKVDQQIQAVKSFCLIQLQLLRDKKETLRKELLNCKLQEEFITKTIEDLEGTGDT